jgi:hypothetical protein
MLQGAKVGFGLAKAAMVANTGFSAGWCHATTFPGMSRKTGLEAIMTGLNALLFGDGKTLGKI